MAKVFFFGLKLHELHQFHVFHHVLVEVWGEATDGWFKAKQLLQNEQILEKTSGLKWGTRTEWNLKAMLVISKDLIESKVETVEQRCTTMTKIWFGFKWSAC